MTRDTETINGSLAARRGSAVSRLSLRLQKLRPHSLILKMGRKSKKGLGTLRRRQSSFQHFRRTSWCRKPVRGPNSPIAKFAAAVKLNTAGTAPIEFEFASALHREPDAGQDSNVDAKAKSHCRSTQKLTKSHHQNKKTTCRLTLPNLHHRKKRPVKKLHHRQWRRPRKIVVVGDMCSGKSELISAYCKDKFSETYIPTLLCSSLTDAKVFGETIELVVVEVAGRDDYARLRQCAYHKMDAVILCYSADSVTSLERITQTWIPELQKHAPKVPYILVGTKKDKKDDYIDQLELIRREGDYNNREDLLRSVVTTNQGSELARSIGAQSFVECSAMYRDGTREVFETAAKVALQKSRRKRKVQPKPDPCVIL